MKQPLFAVPPPRRARVKTASRVRSLKLYLFRCGLKQNNLSFTVGKSISQVRTPAVSNIGKLNQTGKGDSKVIDELNHQVFVRIECQVRARSGNGS